MIIYIIVYFFFFSVSVGHDCPNQPKRRLSDQFGIISQVEDSSVATDLAPIIEEMGEDDD